MALFLTLVEQTKIDCDMVKWKKISDFPAYEVSNDGDVRRRLPGKGCTHPGKILKQTDSGFGYGQLTLISAGGKRYCRQVHRLVASAFLGRAPEGKPFVCHRDGNPANNYVQNLYWASPKENYADSIRHGTWSHGERTGTSKLTAQQVREIRWRYEPHVVTQSQLAREYGVTARAIKAVVTRQNWAWL